MPSKRVATKKPPKSEAKRLMTQIPAEIVVLLDRSGSMSTIKNDMEGGFKTFVEKQQQEPGECKLTLVQFDSQSIDTVYDAVPIANVKGMVLDPRASTPLLDALGKTVASSKERLKDFKGNVIFVIITDGQENASTEYKRDAVKAMIEERTKAGWGFLYLGANVDAFAEGGSIGVMLNNSVNYDPTKTGTQVAYTIASASASAMRGMTATALKVADITEEDRKKAYKAHKKTT